jgi:hypothetical protein
MRWPYQAAALLLVAVFILCAIAAFVLKECLLLLDSVMTWLKGMVDKCDRRAGVRHRRSDYAIALVLVFGAMMISGGAFAQTDDASPGAIANGVAYVCSNQSLVVSWLVWAVAGLGSTSVGGFVIKFVDAKIVALPPGLMKVIDAMALNVFQSAFTKGPPPAAPAAKA